jgi:low temperature requirement protein LtrA
MISYLFHAWITHTWTLRACGTVTMSIQIQLMGEMVRCITSGCVLQMQDAATLGLALSLMSPKTLARVILHLCLS